MTYGHKQLTTMSVDGVRSMHILIIELIWHECKMKTIQETHYVQNIKNIIHVADRAKIRKTNEQTRPKVLMQALVGTRLTGIASDLLLSVLLTSDYKCWPRDKLSATECW